MTLQQNDSWGSMEVKDGYQRFLAKEAVDNYKKTQVSMKGLGNLRSEFSIRLLAYLKKHDLSRFLTKQ